MEPQGRCPRERVRLRPGPRVVVGIAVAWLAAGAQPAVAADPFSALKGMAAGLPTSLPKRNAKPTTDPAAPTAPGDTGAMGFRAATAQAPLHKLGTDAVAVVETATPGAPVQAMDYVFAKQAINLGPKGRVSMSYLSGCRMETIQGGVITVALTGSKVAGGKLTEKVTPGCRATTPVVLASASEAGATVNRVTPFTGQNWDERALKSSSPVFKWDKALGAVSLRVKDMDREGEPVLWQTAVDKDWVAYPANGARLAAGMPYRVEALSGDKVVAAALFSFDPALDVADSLASRVVPLSTP
jgi:hypothetical protein